MDTDNHSSQQKQASRLVDVEVVENGQCHHRQDHVALECPVALEFNGISHAVMLATPTDLEDFALGFALSERIVDEVSQIYDTEVVTGADGVTVAIEIASVCFAGLKDKRRNMTGRTGCGLCGTETLTQVLRPMQALAPSPLRLGANSIEAALQGLRHHQILQQSTGATHAAAWFNLAGEFQLMREDVGRHNALDKLIGAGLRSGRADWREGFLVVTSRASMEMVQKAIIAGFHFLVAISAPTSLAIELAQDHGLCLIGFARPGKWTIYSHTEKLHQNEQSCIT
jgi:FdhD protein